jgi:capsular exopolysaccharide synthesis family protein
VRSSSVQAIEKSGDFAPAALASRSYAEAEQWAAVDIQQVFAMVRRRKAIILAVFSTVLAIAALYAFTAQPKYESQATIEINQKNNSAAAGLGALSALVDTGSNDVQTQIAILQGSPIREKAFATLTPQELAAVKKFCNIDVSGVGQTALVRIAVVTTNPRVSRKLADSLCRIYINETLEDNRDEVRGARIYVENQLKQNSDKLKQAQADLANFKKQNKTFDITAQSGALLTRMTALRSAVDAANADKQAALSQLSMLRHSVAAMPDNTTQPQNLVRSPKVETLKAQLTQLELSLIKAQQEYTASAPQVTDLKNQISGIKRQLRQLNEFEPSTIVITPNTMKQSTQQNISTLETAAQAAASRAAAAQAAWQSAQSELLALPDREYQLGRLLLGTTVLQQSYNTLVGQYQTLMIQEKAKVANAQQRFPADKARLVAPKKARILMLAVPMGLILAFMLAAFIDRMDGRVHSDSEVENATGLPVMAHIPEVAGADKLLAPTMEQSDFQLSESFQMLRTGIAFSVYDNPIRSVLITSSLPSEGKSTCAMNLAIAAAQSGERVILVDCDLRRPASHRLLDLPNRIGFTNVVAGTATLEEALQETSIPGLRVLSSGPTPPNPYRLLHSRGARELLDQLRREADFVVIDTPPALGMADAQLISGSADAILLVVSTKGAKKHEIARTRDFLGQTNVEILGTILNRVQPSFGGYYGQDHYGAYALPQSENGTAKKA